LRCRIVLECAKGQTNRTVARRVGVSEPTVSKWRRRFIAERLEGLHDEPRPGVPRSITDDHVEALIVATLEQTPSDATHWSTRSMAKATGISASSVGRIWRAFGLKPHLVDTFKLSSDMWVPKTSSGPLASDDASADPSGSQPRHERAHPVGPVVVLDTDGST
jgi:transposase